VSAELLVVEQRRGRDDASRWIVEGGRRREGRDGNRRLDELGRGLRRQRGVRAVGATVGDERLRRTLATLHEPDYLAALAAVGAEEEVLPDFAPPGLEPDIPVTGGLVAAAREAARTAIAAAERLLAGARFTYAVCRPPGHHAGTACLGGYCYLNSAAAAALTLREGGLAPLGVLDLDLHYPNGTAELVDRIEGASLHSLHAAPVTNVAPGTVLPWAAGERAVAFAAPPSAAAYLREVAASLEALAECRALVVSLGYDTVAGDPHGGWDFEPELFAAVGRLLAAAGPPVCVVQEGGYADELLADCAAAFAAGLLEREVPRAAAPRERGCHSCRIEGQMTTAVEGAWR
jgi:acetoin utilization deacetylase AcuC-like enzyme